MYVTAHITKAQTFDMVWLKATVSYFDKKNNNKNAIIYVMETNWVIFINNLQTNALNWNGFYMSVYTIHTVCDTTCGQPSKDNA